MFFWNVIHDHYNRTPSCFSHSVVLFSLVPCSYRLSRYIYLYLARQHLQFQIPAPNFEYTFQIFSKINTDTFTIARNLKTINIITNINRLWRYIFERMDERMQIMTHIIHLPPHDLQENDSSYSNNIHSFKILCTYGRYFWRVTN